MVIETLDVCVSLHSYRRPLEIIQVLVGKLLGSPANFVGFRSQNNIINIPKAFNCKRSMATPIVYDCNYW